MKKSIINKKLSKLLFGLLFIGSAALALGIFRAAKNIEHSHQQAF